MDTFLQDLRYTFRSLRKSPVFTVVAVLTLALGIGVVTIMFSVLEGTLLRPLPVVDQSRALVLWKTDPTARFDHIPFSHPAFRSIREQSRSFERLAGIDYSGAWPFSIHEGDEPSLIRGGVASGDFFGVLGVNAVLGRALRSGDDVPGGARVMVISYGLWRQRFGSDPGVIGRKLDLWGESYEIVGVMARGFEYPKGAALWVPSAPLRPQWEEDHQYWNLDLVGRLKPGVSTPQALAELNIIIRRVLALVLAVVGLYGVIASIVVHRTREIAVRMALGAQSGDVRWLVLRQGMLLAAGGAGIGLAAALATTQILASVLYGVSPTDPVTLAAAVALLLAISILACYIPARRATQLDPMMALRGE